jgi:DNA-directed RNA polymerase subunit RPC12/RpoP
MYICNNCKKTFEAGQRSDGLPNGAGFELESGEVINVCTDCIIKMSADDIAGRKRVLEAMKGVK